MLKKKNKNMAHLSRRVPGLWLVCVYIYIYMWKWALNWVDVRELVTLLLLGLRRLHASPHKS